MGVHLTRELDKLKDMILELTAMVEVSVRKAVESVDSRDLSLAESVIANDRSIDLMENDLEEECLKILALHQPVAGDLRYVITCLKMNNDLERIGDLAVNIAERAGTVCNIPRELIPADLPEMAEKSQRMLKLSLDALINWDARLARVILAHDDEIDALNLTVQKKINKLIQKKPKKAQYFIHLLIIARYLERIGDYATNIAEDVLYLVEGEIVRHHAELKLPSPDEDGEESWSLTAEPEEPA